MTCADARQCLSAFLDNELDAALSMELQRHLEHCPECAHDAEIERAIGQKLGRAIGAPTTDIPRFDLFLGELVGGDETFERVMDPAHRTRRHLGNRLIATAAVFAMLLGGGVWLRSRDGSGERVGAQFADLLVTDFERFLQQDGPLEITSSDRWVVRSWFRTNTGMDVHLPDLEAAGDELLGGRSCRIGGWPAALAYYDLNGTPASLVAVAEKPGQLAGMLRVDDRGVVHWVDDCKGHTVVAHRRDGLLYAAVSTLGEGKLLTLITGAAHEGN